MLMLVVGHRGAPSRAPENTMASFEAALAMGVDAIELDVHLSRDGHLVVIHDQNLARTTNGRGLVYEHSLASRSTSPGKLPVGAAGGTATEADMRRLLALGAVRMPTNFPDVCRAVVSAARSKST